MERLISNAFCAVSIFYVTCFSICNTLQCYGGRRNCTCLCFIFKIYLFLSLQDAFILWATYGFPIDLTQVFSSLYLFLKFCVLFL